MKLGLKYLVAGLGLLVGTAHAQTKALLEAAENGNPQAQYQLGQFYALTSSLTTNVDLKQAAQWALTTARQGAANAQNTLNQPVLENALHPDPNEEKAIRWFRAAAKQGFSLAQLALDNQVLTHALGNQQAVQQATNRLAAAAKQGNSGAAAQLAHAYATGQGVPQNLNAAYKWLHLAAQENPDYQAPLQELQTEMQNEPRTPTAQTNLITRWKNAPGEDKLLVIGGGALLLGLGFKHRRRRYWY